MASFEGVVYVFLAVFGMQEVFALLSLRHRYGRNNYGGKTDYGFHRSWTKIHYRSYS